MATPTSSDALVVTSGPLAGQTLPLERRELVVGREPNCDLPLTSYTQMSRRHAKLVPTQNGWAVEDLGSTNGTLVDGARVERAELRHGARLTMGDFEALVRVYAAPASHPAGQSSAAQQPFTVPQSVVPAPAPLLPPVVPGSSPSSAPAMAPRKDPKWAWPVVGVLVLLVVGGMALSGNGKAPDVDPSNDAKVQRAVDTGDATDNPNADASSAQTGSGALTPPKTDSAPPSTELAPPVNGRIAPATVALAKSATVLVVRPEGQSLAFGSGFVSGNGHQVVTNRHVVADETGNVGDCILVFEAGTANERKVKVPASSIELASGSEQFSSDLALLDLPPDARVPAALPLGRSENLSETDTTWVFGFPLGVGTLTLDQELPSVSVKAASIERIQRGNVEGQDAAKVLQLGSTVTHGNSGGPVLNANGEVVGVISQGNEGTGISYAIPTVWVKRLVR